MSLVDSELALRLYREGRNAWERGKRDEALDLLKRSAQAALHFKTLELLGELLLEMGRPFEAAVHLGAAAALSSDSSRPRFFLGRALLQLELRDEARKQLQKAIEQRPQFKAAKNLLAQLGFSEVEEEALHRSSNGSDSDER